EPPEVVPGGWETYTYGLRLRPATGLPPHLAGPLVLRIYASPQGEPRARYEYAVQQHLGRLGYPVARPLHLEDSSGLFEGPCILHLDWHPMNVMQGAGGDLTILDWTEADVGDPHADLAMALLLMTHAPAEEASLWARAAVPVGRLLMAWWYFQAYRRRRPLD